MMTPEEILRVEKDIVLTLKNVYDPEIPVNIYDLGLIYEIDFDPSGEATIRMTLTAPNCPMADMLVEDVNVQVGKVAGVKSVYYSACGGNLPHSPCTPADSCPWS